MLVIYIACVFLSFSAKDTLSNRESTQILTSVQMIELKGSWSWGKDCNWIYYYLHEPCMTAGCRYYQGFYIYVYKFPIVRCEGPWGGKRLFLRWMPQFLHSRLFLSPKVLRLFHDRTLRRTNVL